MFQIWTASDQIAGKVVRNGADKDKRRQVVTASQYVEAIARNLLLSLDSDHVTLSSMMASVWTRLQTLTYVIGIMLEILLFGDEANNWRMIARGSD